MFTGEYDHTIDAKGRMFLPAKFRGEFGDRVILARGIDKCVCIYPVEEWEKYIEKIKNLPVVKARKAKRLISATASETEIDGQGRVLIPAKLREYAGLEKNVKVIGNTEIAEIWTSEAYDEFLDSMSAEELEKELTELGL